jgi:hypothetical protein
LTINLSEVEETRFELSEPSGRVFKAPGTSFRLIKNVLDKVKRDLGNFPLFRDPKRQPYFYLFCGKQSPRLKPLD